MKWLFWVSGVLLTPLAIASAVFFGLYIAGGDDRHRDRAKAFYRWCVVIVLATFDIWIFTRVFQGLWELFTS